MCGIFGYVGKKDSSSLIKKGLQRMEYRGYDSWGIAIKSGKKIIIEKNIGAIGDMNAINSKVKNSSAEKSFIGIGHTRWATHGGVTQTNAHPHSASDGSFVLAQNGIVENYQELKAMLIEKGYKFESETDTEVIVRLIEDKVQRNQGKNQNNAFIDSVKEAFLELKGRNTIIVLERDADHIIAIRNGSPLVVGVGEDEYFFASDILSFSEYTDRVILIDDMQIVEYLDNQINISNVLNGKKVEIIISQVEKGLMSIDKSGFDHYMIKEIVEQQHTVREAISYSLDDLEDFLKAIKSADTIYTTGAGTASHAAGQISYFLRTIAGIRSFDLKSYEIDSFREILTKNDILLVLSQSGETADTIEAINIAKKKGVKIASIVNMLGSTITRMSDFKFFSRSGPEICVASTKAFTAQISFGYLLAKSIKGEYSQAKMNIEKLSMQLDKYLCEDLFKHISSIAKKLQKHEHFFILGKDQNYIIALEGALKIKEITYKHFEGFAAGELKHGVIALVEKGTPVLCITSNDRFSNDMISAAAEVKARGAWTIGVGQINSDFFDDFIKVECNIDEISSIANVIPLQLISYYLGVALGNNVDKPRNLAKSVTVK